MVDSIEACNADNMRSYLGSSGDRQLFLNQIVRDAAYGCLMRDCAANPARLGAIAGNGSAQIAAGRQVRILALA